MSIQNAFASVAVKDIESAAEWYAELLGNDGSRPMPELVEWTFERGGVLQVYQAPERAGSGSLTLAVSDLDEEIRKLDAMGVDTLDRSDGTSARTLMVQDPDGNHVAYAEATDPALAK